MKTQTCIHAVLASLALPLAGFAEDKTPPPVPPYPAPADSTLPPKAPNNAKEGLFAGPITAVSREDKTITINDTKRGTHKLLIDENTKLMRGEKTATWDDLKIGTNVEGMCRSDKEAAQAETVTIKE